MNTLLQTASLAIFLQVAMSMFPFASLAHSNAPIAYSPDAVVDDGLTREIKVFSRAEVSAAASIAAFETHLVGARVVDLSFDGASEFPAFRVKAVYRRQIWVGAVDYITGEVREVRHSMPVEALASNDRSNIVDLSSSELSVSDALTIAENTTSAKALSVGLVRADGHFLFLVVVLADGALREVSINPAQLRRRGR